MKISPPETSDGNIPCTGAKNSVDASKSGEHAPKRISEVKKEVLAQGKKSLNSSVGGQQPARHIVGVKFQFRLLRADQLEFSQHQSTGTWNEVSNNRQVDTEEAHQQKDARRSPGNPKLG